MGPSNLDEAKLASVLSDIINSGPYKMSLPATTQELGPVDLGTPIEFQLNKTCHSPTDLGPAQAEEGNHASIPQVTESMVRGVKIFNTSTN